MLSSIGNQGNPAVSQSPTSTSNVQLSPEADRKESATAPKFGEVYQQIQAKYGQKAEKPREVKKNLGKDDFLRIMMTQMQHQDPTNPFKAEQMATQVAQFTSVEQLQNINQSVNKLGSQNKPLEQMMMTNMIGKTVTIDRERFPHSEGENEALGFTLSKNSESTRVSIVGPTGEEVFHKDLGKQNAGEVNLAWDGIGSNSLPAKTGDYTLKVEAKDDRGQNILMNSQAQSRVVGVSFEGTEPILLVGDGKHQEKITMRNVVRVDLDQGQMGRSPGAEAMRKTNPSPATFMPLPILNNVSAQTASQQVQGSKAAVNVVSRDVEKGFPNGLKD